MAEAKRKTGGQAGSQVGRQANRQTHKDRFGEAVSVMLGGSGTSSGPARETDILWCSAQKVTFNPWDEVFNKERDIQPMGQTYCGVQYRA